MGHTRTPGPRARRVLLVAVDIGAAHDVRAVCLNEARLAFGLCRNAGAEDRALFRLEIFDVFYHALVVPGPGVPFKTFIAANRKSP